MYKCGVLAFFLLLAMPSGANTLRVGDWQALEDPNKQTYHESRRLAWWRGETMIRSCQEVRFGRYEKGTTKKARVKGPATHQMLDNDCDFITLGEAGWVVAPTAKESRKAYLAQWD
jgi:hypothetical protein